MLYVCRYFCTIYCNATSVIFKRYTEFGLKCLTDTETPLSNFKVSVKHFWAKHEVLTNASSHITEQEDDYLHVSQQA